MKKYFLILILISLSFSTLLAQNSIREKGTFSIDAGIGLGVRTSGYSLVLPPVKVDAEYTFLTFGTGSLAVGGYFSLGSTNLTSKNVNVSTFLVGPSSSVRYALSDNFDVFLRLIVGYVGVNTSEPIVNSSLRGSHMGAGSYIGGTWYFSPKMGLGGEVGYGGPTVAGVHLTFKF